MIQLSDGTTIHIRPCPPLHPTFKKFLFTINHLLNSCTFYVIPTEVWLSQVLSTFLYVQAVYNLALTDCHMEKLGLLYLM